MRRLSIARSFRLALVGLTLVLAIIAGLGIASLYRARQHYEDTLASSAALSVASANLVTASIAEDEVLRDDRGPAGAGARHQAAAAYDAAAARAQSLAHDDPTSQQLLSQQIAQEQLSRRLAGSGNLQGAIGASGPLVRARGLATALQARQQTRQDAARSTARSDSRRAILIVGIAGLLAVAAAMILISALIAAVRRPLDDLVRATAQLAAGNLQERVSLSGPRELRELGDAFNAMSEDLAVAQRRIEDQRRRLAVTIESLGDALIVTEPGSSRVAATNPKVAELVPEISVGTDLDAEEVPLPPLKAALEGETTMEHQEKTLAVTAARLGDESQGLVWTVRDISERARLERAKTEFVATASHELRSPLTSIKGFVELLQRSPEGMSERQREFVDIILNSSNRLVELVNDLLDVARIEADHMEIDLRSVDVGEAVREVAELMGPRIEAKRQQLTVHVAPTVPEAHADPRRLRQIVANLVTNAHQYTDEGGSIRIRVAPDRAWVQITVEDSGVGMTAEQSHRVFERFYRVRDGGSTGQGTGLGLSIVKSLVELQHGRIDVQSVPGRGSAFRVMLPATAPSPEIGEGLEAIRGARVLVVDDERAIAELIAGQLAPLDVQAEIATAGEEALARLREDQFDAVTLDVLMPGLDGLELLRQIRQDPVLGGIPIVFVSVFSGRQELAGEWVVSKPIDADELRNVLAAAVQSGRSRVLVVGRQELQELLSPALQELGIDHQWEVTGAAAARACSDRRFEVALVDVGIRNPPAVLQALDLRGRRRRRAVILFSDGRSANPPGVAQLGLEVVPVDAAAIAVQAALRDRSA
jgi:signal transduction histidine kinase/DNA-binding response OmpR family regulator/HAMP domain-containing protein